jgi:hypothetical protein
METYFIIAIATNKGTRYIDNEDSQEGTLFEKNAQPFETQESAQSFIDDNQYQNCSVIEFSLTYDVVFNNDDCSNEKCFQLTKKECVDYVNRFNGSNESYFADYKGGTVEVICNETGEIVYSQKVK